MTEEVPSNPGADHQGAPLAPVWHTAALVTLIVAVAIAGTVLEARGARVPGARPTDDARVADVYLPMLVVQCGLVLYVSRVGRGGNALPSLLGRRWNGVRRAATDVAVAIAAGLAIEALTLAWDAAFGASGGATVSALVPHTWTQRLAWTAVAASAGFCEEVVYRGYLQTQLTALTGRTYAGLVLSAALFGVAHADQGLAAVPRVALCGLVLGAVARWRRSLWPGILCHSAIDVASVLLRAG